MMLARMYEVEICGADWKLPYTQFIKLELIAEWKASMKKPTQILIQ
jgi:hypothetical protein